MERGHNHRGFSGKKSSIQKGNSKTNGIVEVNKLNGVPDFVRGSSAVHRNMKLTNSFGLKDDPAAIPKPLAPSR